MGVSTTPLTRSYAPDGPLDLARTLGIHRRGSGDPTVRVDAGHWWFARREADGPALLRLERQGELIAARAWGPGASTALGAVPGLLGHGDDWSGLDLDAQPVLRELRRRHPGLRLSASGQVFDALVPAIIEQKVTGVEAWGSWRRLLRAHGERPPGPAPEGMIVPPPAAVWHRIPSWQWHRAGVGPERSRAIVRAAERAPALERLAGRPAAQARAPLESLPGIGPWTSAETLLRSHADPDAVSVGDYHLARTVGFAFTGTPATDADMLTLLAPWAGHRQRILRLIGLAGIRTPPRGPRMTIQDHRRH